VAARLHPGSPSSLIGAAAMLVVWAAVLARTLRLADASEWPWYIAGFSAFLAVLLFVVFRRPMPGPLTHVAMVVQAAIVLLLLAIDPDRDFVTVLFVLQCYQAAVAFPALPRTVWVVVLVSLIGGSLVLELGLVRGLALGLVPMAAGVVLSMYVVANRELEEGRAAAELLVKELRAAQERLREYAGQADELAALEQRSQVAGELEDSVSRTLAQALDTSAAARGLLDAPELAAPQLERLQELTKQALAQMRRIITELRPHRS
jgi:signal transduction histidine kinase